LLGSDLIETIASNQVLIEQPLEALCVRSHEWITTEKAKENRRVSNLELDTDAPAFIVSSQTTNLHRWTGH
jgi:hypothetical protein